MKSFVFVNEIPWDNVKAQSILKSRSKFTNVRVKLASDANFKVEKKCQGIFLEEAGIQAIKCECILDASNIGVVELSECVYIIRNNCQNCVVKLAWAKKNLERLSDVDLYIWPKPKDCSSCNAQLNFYNSAVILSSRHFYFDSLCRSCTAQDKKRKQIYRNELIKIKVKDTPEQELKKMRYTRKTPETTLQLDTSPNSEVFSNELKSFVEEVHDFNSKRTHSC